MKNFKELKEKFSNQIVFFVMAIIMSIITLFLSIYLITFVISNLNNVFSVESKPIQLQQFDIKGFEKLNLVK